MNLCGLNKTTLLDYPGKVAATLFFGGCNFRCPFCQNSSLVIGASSQHSLDPEQVLSFLKKRSSLLDGVCITGGEPTLEPELWSFLKDIKSLGYAIKLDTNGSRPEVVKALAGEGLIDKVAMDIKSSPDRYPVLTGVSIPDTASIEETASFLLHGSLDYEFRTTVVKELHNEEDFHKISEWLSGAKEYYLQAYKDSETVIQPGFSSYTKAELEAFRRILLTNMKKVELRGI